MEGEDSAKNNNPIIIEDNPVPFKVKIKLLSNETYEFQISPSMNVLEFKKLITAKVSVPIERMRLVFAGRQLKDQDSISEYVKQTGLTVHLIARSIPENNANQNPQQQPQQNPPNPFGDIMGMMGGMFGGAQNVSSQGPHISMSFNNPNPSSINSLLGNFGIRLPQPPSSANQPSQQSQPPRQQPQSPVQANNNNNQTQRISYNEIGRLNQSINTLNLPIDNVTSTQQVITNQGVARYLRRLYHQNTRSLMQLNRVISLLQNGDSTHLANFIPVFKSLNDANNVAVDCITKLNQSNNQASNVSQQSSQSQQPQQTQPVIQPGVQPGIQMNPLMQMGGMFSQLFGQQPQNQQPQQRQQPSSSEPSSQQQQPSLSQPLPMMGGLNIGQIFNSMGGMGGIGPMMNMSIRDMIEQGGQSSTSVSRLLTPITGSNIIQAITSKNFEFLNEKHSELRSQLLQILEEKPRGEVIQDLSHPIASILVSTDLPESPLTISNIQKCHQDSIKIIAKTMDHWITLTLQEHPDSYASKTMGLFKQMFCKHISNVIKNTTSEDSQIQASHEQKQKYAFIVLKIKAVNALNLYAAGLADLFYSLIEKDLVRVYREYREEEQRKGKRSQLQTLEEEKLLNLIKESGQKDSEYLAEMKHSNQYFGEYAQKK